MLIEDAQLPSGLRVKLLDFGIAKIIDEANANHFKTKTGALLGSQRTCRPSSAKAPSASRCRPMSMPWAS